MQFFPSAAQVPSSHYKASPSARQAVEIPKLSLYGKAMLPLKPSHGAREQLHHTTEHHFWDSLSAGLGERIYSWHIQKRALPKSFNVREALHMMEAAGIPGPLSPEPSMSQPVLWVVLSQQPEFSLVHSQGWTYSDYLRMKLEIPLFQLRGTSQLATSNVFTYPMSV